MTYEIPVEERDFATTFEELRQRGADIELTARLYPMLASANTRHALEAQRFVMKHRAGGPADPDDIDTARQHHMLVQEAKQMVLRAGYQPTPQSVLNRHVPGEKALNDRLDAAHPMRSYNGDQKFGELGEPDARPNNPLAGGSADLSHAGQKKVYSLVRRDRLAKNIDV